MGEPTQDFLTINIDFGTSNTAAGYTFLDSDQEKRVQVGIFESNNLKWIAFDGGTSQVRSQLAWLSDKEDFLFGKEVDDAINDGLLPETARIQMLKLALEAEDAMVKDVHDDVLEKLDQIHRESGIQFSTLELVAIFLLKILSRIKRMISIARGEDIFKTAKVQYLLSVPALWGLEARSLMIEAAEAAEMFDVKLISEPEAAAFFFMHDRLAEKPGLRDKQEAEGILVLDVGGGTAVSSGRAVNASRSAYTAT